MGKLVRAVPVVKAMVLGAFTLEAHGLTVKGRPSYEDYCDVGRFCAHTHRASGWWLVDWLTYGEGREEWAEKIDQAIGITGLAAKTLYNIRAARHIDVSRRREDLDFTHHLEVAALSPPEQDEWLERAETEGWTARELRENVRASKRRLVVEGQAQLEGMYRVIYADPPWCYRDSGATIDGSLGKVERHYQTLTIDELCKLPVKAHTLPNAVLFLWTTTPLLLDAPGPREVIEAWGFTPKSGMVWDKVLGMPGRFVQVQHEHLIIAERGACPPDVPTPKPHSVFTERRSDVHSQKPTAIRKMIERLYTTGPYLELFGSTRVDGWDVFGNDARLWHTDVAK